MNQNQKIKRTIESYSSIVDLEETNEVMHLIAELDDLMTKQIRIAILYKELHNIPENKRYALASKGVEIINKINRIKSGVE